MTDPLADTTESASESSRRASDRETVFVYGTLTDEDRVGELLESFRFLGSAVCLGLRRIDGRYPTLVPGARVTGRLLETPEIARLDAYEGVDSGLYVRVSVPIVDESSGVDDATGGGDRAFVYIADPERLGIDSADVSPADRDVVDSPAPTRSDRTERLWPPGDSFVDRIESYCRSASVRIVSEPRPDDP